MFVIEGMDKVRKIIEENRKRKLELQKLYEELEECGRRLTEYKECFGIIRKRHPHREFRPEKA